MTRRIDNPDTKADIDLRAHIDRSTSFVMIAGAGSGKTTSLVKALAYVGEVRGKSLQQRGQRVACITYTEIATQEIFGDVGHDPLFHVSTIHSFLWDLVKPFQKDIKAWVRNHIAEKLVELREERNKFGPKVQSKTREKNQHKIERFENLQSFIAAVRRFRYEMGSDYANGILGHDDIIKMAPTLIQERPLLRKLIAQKYPYFFVDESQDTVSEVVNALKGVEKDAGNQFCLGFFGDPMQQIYMTGIGKIELSQDWVKIEKPENFRCPVSVLSTVNAIRRKGDSLQQTIGIKKINGAEAPPSPGTARLFILPADKYRDQNLAKVRQYAARENKDPLWISDKEEADVKILVIVHRMAATRLGFDRLYAALNDDASESFKAGFREGTLWALQPFLKVLLPLVEAFNCGRHFEVMTLLRKYSPRLSKESLKASEDTAALLDALKDDVGKLIKLLSPHGQASILEVLQFVDSHQFIVLDDKFREYLSGINLNGSSILDIALATEEETASEKVMEAYLKCPAAQLFGYRAYIEEKSAYSTQHGVKGAEYQRVVVVLDDEESTFTLYSYEKLLGLVAPSPADIKNQTDGKDSVFDRTRRLFYVCCSRAVKDLVVILFTADVSGAKAVIQGSAIFDPKCIKSLDDLKDL